MNTIDPATQLLSCPYCGQTEDGIMTEQFHSYETKRGCLVYLWHVTCRKCTADVTGQTAEHAQERWNQRFIEPVAMAGSH